jgi:hypothetical protein
MSQEEKILNHMKRYGSITPMTALEKYGCFRLAARIAEIRQVHKVDTEIVQKGRKRFAKYRLVA